MADTTAEVLQANRALLAAIDSMNWAAYAELCDPSLTAF